MAKSITQLLNYDATHYEAITRYHVSLMILHIHSDASFLLDSEFSIREGGYHYLSAVSVYPRKVPLKQPPPNVPVHVKYTTVISIIASVMEA